MGRARERIARAILNVDPPHDLDATASFLHAPGDPFVRRDARGLSGVVRTRSGPALVRLEPAGARRIDVTLTLQGRADEGEALQAAGRLAGVAPHASARGARRKFLAAARRDPRLAPLLKACRGLGMPQRVDAVASVTAAILAQQITTAFARELCHALWALHGERVRLGGDDWLLPPRAEVVAGLSPDDLRPLRISGRKGEYMSSLCREIAGGTLDLLALAEVTAEEAMRQLVARRGIGPTTAAWLLMFAGGHDDAWPPSDVGLGRALDGLVGSREGSAVEDLLAQFAGTRSWLAVHLWQAQRLAR